MGDDLGWETWEVADDGGSDSVGGNKVKTAGRVLVREATCPQGRV